MVYLEYQFLSQTFARDFSSKKLFANTFLFSEDDLLTADDFMANKTHRSARRRKPAKGQRVGYLRVSSLDQNEVHQLEGLALNKHY
jgi:hypothetical protein